MAPTSDEFDFAQTGNKAGNVDGVADKVTDSENKLRDEEPVHLRRDVDADLEDFLRMVARAAGLSDPDVVAAQIEWVKKHFTPADIALSRVDLDAIEKGYVMPGTPVELQKKLESASAGAWESGGGRRWRRFARTTLASTLRRMEERGDTPEEEMDALVRALRPVRENLSAAAGELMLAASAHLELQFDTSDGYYRTRGALAELLSTLKDSISRRRRCYLYWKILDEIRELGGDRIGGRVWAGIVNTDANNLSVALDDLGEDRPSVDWMKIAVISGSAARRLGDEASAPAGAEMGLQAFFGDLSAPDKSPNPEWAAILDDMGNVPGIWRSASAWVGADEVDMWLVELGAAVARCAVGDVEERTRKVAMALFNAGVTVSRGARLSTNWIEPVACRVAINGAGLRWVLAAAGRHSSKELAMALNQNKGGGCLVNLMGALVDMSAKPSRNLSPYRQSEDGGAIIESDEFAKAYGYFVAHVAGLQTLVGGDARTRIDGSMARLAKLIRVDAMPATMFDGLVPSLHTIVAACLPDQKWRAKWDAYGTDPNLTTLGALLAETARRGHRHFDNAVLRVRDALAEFESKGLAWPEAFLEFEPKREQPDWYAAVESQFDGLVKDRRGFPVHLIAVADRLLTE